ncbi:MAG: host attachment protein [Symploca sp. SIO1C4]|uniref:Host attachment protein n=1 Tax=Symploca sp. SIO1C4 TaxID=2607765 RepID=A0A6B3NDX6_9CYAN|nr:host attachment protein [Symploca sp. SIO1C4]NET05599.1 host attachment protein [Symploca sp. SIO2B6]
MSGLIVAVVDGTRARFFSLEQVQLPEYESGPNLVERETLFNRAKELAGKELWASVKTGRNQGKGSQGHAYDDHRQNHLSEFGRRFAQIVANQIAKMAQVEQAQRLILVAEPQILGLLREVLAPLLPRNPQLKNLQIQELAKDLSKLKPIEIHQSLASKDLMPARKKLST